jgi:hypothetical protein
MWESPLKTTFFLVVCTGAILSEHILVLFYFMFFISLLFHGFCNENIHTNLGMSCFHRDAQIEPAFANSSRAEFLEQRKKKWSSPWSILVSMTGQNDSGHDFGNMLTMATHPDQFWHSLKDRALAQIQLQLRDGADIAEKLNSFILWRCPKATCVGLFFLSFGIIAIHILPFQLAVKFFGEQCSLV